MVVLTNQGDRGGKGMTGESIRSKSGDVPGQIGVGGDKEREV